MTTSTEKTEFIQSILGKSKNTQKLYVSKYDKLYSHFDNNIRDIENSDIIEFLKTISNANSRAAVLNIAIHVKRMYSLDIGDLVSYRNVVRNNIQTHLVEKNNSLIETLPDMNTLKAYTDNLYDNNEYIKFIINYLLINYYVRNVDLDVSVVDKRSDVTDEDNYLLILQRPTRVEYIRNVYKTHKIYGNKSFVIEDKRFYKACKQFVGQRLIPGNVAYFVRKSTYNEMGESNYAKIAIDHIRESGNINELLKISSRRGTSVNTLMNSYNIQVESD